MPPTRPERGPGAPPGTGAPDEAVAPLMRGLAVLELLAGADGGPVSLSGLEKATGLARSTVDRIAATLARLGYVRLDGRDVVVAPRLLEPGNAYLASTGLPALLGPPANALADELDESVSLAVPDGDGVRFVHQATRRRAMSLSFRIGDLLPAERTAPGALFAADWEADDWEAWRTYRAADPDGSRFPSMPAGRDGHPEEDFRRRTETALREGWATDDQMIEPGLVALSVPVRRPDGRTACVLSVVSHTSRSTADGLREALLDRLRATASGMEKALARPRDERTGEHRVPEPLAGRAAASKQELGREFIESLARGLGVLTAFGAGAERLTLAEVAQATGLARATARRALITLTHLGYTETDGRHHWLTPRVLGLAHPALSRTTLARIARPHLARLSSSVKDSASLAVLSDDCVQYVARAATRRVMSVNITVGTRFPAFATSLGRVLLADLPHPVRNAFLDGADLRVLAPRTLTGTAELGAEIDRVGEQGYALVDEELEAGLRSIAVPVRDRTGAAVAALNVAMHSSSRTRRQCLDEVLPPLRSTASAIEEELRIAARFLEIAVM
ncbi:helix-turn-helix domain-containing protein [Streptomyces sp. NBC_01218]|uniref:IclR family transcriptional regulator domain-containing protein n=1 Tax=Streptomyces sp. NBC_01218 TaxID=2903780 RepID=UPI002E15079A|nr:helix-turn-helix domain-containing protein [Streptomyces sp. NBC_01218]